VVSLLVCFGLQSVVFDFSLDNGSKRLGVHYLGNACSSKLLHSNVLT